MALWLYLLPSSPIRMPRRWRNLFSALAMLLAAISILARRRRCLTAAVMDLTHDKPRELGLDLQPLAATP